MVSQKTLSWIISIDLYPPFENNLLKKIKKKLIINKILEI